MKNYLINSHKSSLGLYGATNVIKHILFLNLYIIVSIATIPFTPAQSRPMKYYHGPFNATIQHVIDADTVAVRVDLWPSVYVNTKVRLRGIDTPETKRFKCIDEKLLADRATQYVKSVIKEGDKVRLYKISFGKYAGRVIGDLRIRSPGERWQSLSQTLLASGYAKPYWGRRKKSWCE